MEYNLTEINLEVENFLKEKGEAIRKTISSFMKVSLNNPIVDEIYQISTVELSKPRVWMSFQYKSKRFTWSIGIVKNIIFRYRANNKRQFEKTEEYKTREESKYCYNNKKTLETLSLEEQEILNNFLEYIPEKYKETLLLKLKGYTFKEISLIQGIPLSTASSRLSYLNDYIERFHGNN